MSSLLQFLQTYEIPLYIMLGIVGLFYIRKLILSWKEWRMALFGLERDIAQNHFVTALTMVILFLLIAVSIFFMVTFIAPTFPGLNDLMTPTIDIAATTGTVSPVVQEAASTSVPPAEAANTTGCIPDKLEWTQPKTGEEISGIVELKGTVMLENLGFYKFEFSQPGVETWQAISSGNMRVEDDTLGGLWDTSKYIPGEYLLRLTAYDNDQTEYPPCIIPVRVIAPTP